MKDYSLNLEEKKLFIKKYKIKKDKMIITLATNEKYVIPYTEENESKVLSRMESQVKNVDNKFIKKIETKYNISKLMSSIITFLSIIIMCYMIIMNIGNVIFVTPFIALTVISMISTIEKKHKLRDLRKMRLFIQNYNEINENIKENKNMQIGLKTKTVSQIKKSENEVFNVNTIDSVSLSELKKIKSNLERIKEFNFDECNENENEKVYFKEM